MDGVEYHLALRPVVKYHLRRGVGLMKFLKMALDPSPPPLATYLCKRAPCLNKRATYLQHICAKEPYISTKEPSVYTKGHYDSLKGHNVSVKDLESYLYASAKEHHV